jgi:glycyl-tRNA synthetase beta chain
MAELLLELFSEEIPARMQARAAEDLKRLVLEKLKEERLAHTRAEAFATPRRLALVIDGLPLSQPDVSEELRGPKVDAPDQAIQGFLRKAGLASLDQCEKRATDKGEFWIAVVTKKGVQTSAALPIVIRDVIAGLPWPKSMRWQGNAFKWVRPLHSIVATLDGALLHGAINLADGQALKFGDTTTGHRFLAPDRVRVAEFGDYRAKLRESFVVLDPAERRAAILVQAEKLATSAGLKVKPDDALFDEVTGLVEWPVVLMGAIDSAFMELPPEVLTATMRANQKYFSLLDKNGKLAPRFLVVSNMETKDGGKAIVAGNERVLRARLADAKFFWDQDRKIKLEERVPALKDIVFHAKLGTVADKVQRIQALAAELVPYVKGADVDQVRSAALLAKADLTSGMVGEFPELQGIMGRYYALQEGETPAVADAIAEHYGPLGPGDRCPNAPVSIAVALADKIDTLVGFFAIDEKPTGSKDPFALRRAALGAIRLIVENKLRIPLTSVFGEAAYLLSEQHGASGGQFDSAVLLDFFADRLKVALREKGVRHDLISAVFALGGEDDLVRLLARVDALRNFLDSEDGANLLMAYRRASNIVRIEEKKDKTSYNSGVDPERLVQDEERTLHGALGAAIAAGERALKNEDFTGAMAALAGLRRPVDAFFDRVTVNCEEPALRANRLRLLSEIRATLGRVADFSRIEG